MVFFLLTWGGGKWNRWSLHLPASFPPPHLAQISAYSKLWPRDTGSVSLSQSGSSPASPPHTPRFSPFPCCSSLQCQGRPSSRAHPDRAKRGKEDFCGCSPLAQRIPPIVWVGSVSGLRKGESESRSIMSLFATPRTTQHMEFFRPEYKALAKEGPTHTFCWWFSSCIWILMMLCSPLPPLVPT